MTSFGLTACSAVYYQVPQHPLVTCDNNHDMFSAASARVYSKPHTICMS
jgi:hypothetical protein